MASTRNQANNLILTDAFAYKAPIGTTAPTDTTTAWAAGWLELGWIDNEGLTETPQGSVTELKGVTGATLAYVKDGDGWEVSGNFNESNKVTESLLYQNATVATAGGITTSTVRAQTVPSKFAFGFEFWYNNGSKRRLVFPLGSCTVSGVVNHYTDFRKFPISFTSLQASDGTLIVNITDNAAETVP